MIQAKAGPPLPPRDVRNCKPDSCELLSARLLSGEVKWRLHYFERAHRAAAYACANVHRRIVLDDLAGAAGMHPTAFSRYFVEKIGITPGEFVRMLKVEQAINRIEARDCSVAELAETLGYAHASSFIRSFKRTTGTSPARFKERLLGRGGAAKPEDADERRN